MFCFFSCSFRRIIYGVEKIKLPSESDIDEEVKDMCEVFKTQHMQQCRQSIIRDIRYACLSVVHLHIQISLTYYVGLMWYAVSLWLLQLGVSSRVL